MLPDRTPRQTPRSNFATALELVPTDTTVPFQHRLQGALLHLGYSA